MTMKKLYIIQALTLADCVEPEIVVRDTKEGAIEWIDKFLIDNEKALAEDGFEFDEDYEYDCEYPFANISVDEANWQFTAAVDKIIEVE